MNDFTNGAHECFCDRKYKDANKLASCGDCPRDYIAGAWDARRKHVEEHSKMTDRQTTHAQGCWDWGPRHYECAVRRVERLEEAINAYKSECDNPVKDYLLRAKRRDEMFALLRAQENSND